MAAAAALLMTKQAALADQLYDTPWRDGYCHFACVSGECLGAGEQQNTVCEPANVRAETGYPPVRFYMFNKESLWTSLSFRNLIHRNAC